MALEISWFTGDRNAKKTKEKLNIDVAHNPSLLYTINESMKKLPYTTLTNVVNFFDAVHPFIKFSTETSTVLDRYESLAPTMV